MKKYINEIENIIEKEVQERMENYLEEEESTLDEKEVLHMVLPEILSALHEMNDILNIESKEWDSSLIQILFINAHTLKGNTIVARNSIKKDQLNRTISKELDKISELARSIEQFVFEDGDSKTTLNFSERQSIPLLIKEIEKHYSTLQNQ